MKKNKLVKIVAGVLPLSTVGIAAVAQQCNPETENQFSEEREQILISSIALLSNYDSSQTPFADGTPPQLSAAVLINLLSRSVAGLGTSDSPSFIRTISFDNSQASISFDNNFFVVTINSPITVTLFSNSAISNFTIQSSASQYVISGIFFNTSTNVIYSGTWSFFPTRSNTGSTRQSLLFFAFSYLSNFNTAITPPNTSYGTVGTALLTQILSSSIFTNGPATDISRISFLNQSLEIIAQESEPLGFYIRIGTAIVPGESTTGVFIDYQTAAGSSQQEFEPIYISNLAFQNSSTDILISSFWSLSAP